VLASMMSPASLEMLLVAMEVVERLS